MSDPGKPIDPHSKSVKKARGRRIERRRLATFGVETNQSNAKKQRSSSSSDEFPNEGSESGIMHDGSGSLTYGHVSLMERRRVMEDAVSVSPPGWPMGEYEFFAVYDGHGGADVAERCRDKMHVCVRKHIEKVKKKAPVDKHFDWEKVMLESFGSMERELERNPPAAEDGVTPEAVVEERMIGSTALVVLVGKEEMVVANCGDSRAVLCRDAVAMALSIDHKPQPDRPDEKERIEAAGGRVLDWNGCRVEGVLATSRSFGDGYLKPYITAVPEVTVVSRSESDEFLVIASDGLFDVVPNETACEVVNKYRTGLIPTGAYHETPASTAAIKLAELAIAKGSEDNISVIIVMLK